MNEEGWSVGRLVDGGMPPLERLGAAHTCAPAHGFYRGNVGAGLFALCGESRRAPLSSVQGLQRGSTAARLSLACAVGFA